MKDISFDLETLGASANSKILSIGAAYFDRYTGEIGETFYLALDTDDDPKGEVSDATLKWWSEQDASARSVFAAEQKWRAKDAVFQLRDFVDREACVWGNGASFDITILGSYIARHGDRDPWQFRNIRDMRTVMDLAGNPALPFVGTRHNALDDAIHQAKVIAECVRRLTR
jgi:hypothetical protein